MMEHHDWTEVDFDELLTFAKMNSMCMKPGCTTCGCMPFRKLCRDTIGYENICDIIRAMTPEYFRTHYTLDWMYAATILDIEFRREGGLPRDNSMMQELERLSQAHEEARRNRKNTNNGQT